MKRKAAPLAVPHEQQLGMPGPLPAPGALPLAQVTATHQMQIGTSPLPTPEMLKGYAELRPDFPERLMAMVEGQASHRQKQEGKIVDSQIANARLGMWLGFAIAVIGLGTAAYIAQLGHPTSAAVVSVADLAVLAGVFIRGQQKEKK